MKTNPNPWFVDRNPPRNAVDGGNRSLTIDGLFGDSAASGRTLAAALFGDSAYFDFSRSIHALASGAAPVPATSPTGVAPDGHAALPDDVRYGLPTPLQADDMPAPLSSDSTNDAGTVPIAPVNPIITFAPQVVDAAADSQKDTSSLPTNTLALPFEANEPAEQPGLGRIADLGFLQNLPAVTWVPRPGTDLGDPVIRPSASAVIPVGSELLALDHDGALAHPGLIYELTPALVADATIPLALFLEHNGAEAAVVSELFITDPAPLPDFGSVQFAAVLPDPIVDPGPLV